MKNKQDSSRIEVCCLVHISCKQKDLFFGIAYFNIYKPLCIPINIHVLH